MNKFHQLLLPIATLLLSFSYIQKTHITIYLIGASTMASYDAKYAPLTGWGMPFSQFFDSTVTVRDEARSGRSTRTFIEENLWQPISDSLKPGDYVFIHFGHNDEVQSKKSYTTKADYRTNLIRFVNETRAKGSFPILFTPVARRQFDSSGRIMDTHAEYAAIVLQVAAEYKVPCIDLNRQTQAVYQALGAENSKLYFNYLVAGQNPHYPTGNVDDTHANELGARKIAELVLADIKDLKLELADRIFKPEEISAQ